MDHRDGVVAALRGGVFRPREPLVGGVARLLASRLRCPIGDQYVDVVELVVVFRDAAHCALLDAILQALECRRHVGGGISVAGDDKNDCHRSHFLI